MPHEISTAPDGSVILSDRQNHRVSVFSGDGSLIKRFGSFGEGEGSEGDQFSEPHGVAVDNNGNIYVCDRYNFRISKFASSGEYLYGWKTCGTSDNSSHFPLGVIISGDGSVYVTDQLSHSVQKYK
jgi:DNA-binding beta-propeller fold protein YncE